MAATMLGSMRRTFVCNVYNLKSPKYLSSAGRRCAYSTSANASVVESENAVEYPPIKTRFPPGKWGDFPEPFAWHLHQEALELNEIPKVKERLEKMAGCHNEPKRMWCIEDFEKRPGTLPMKQHVTKTHIIKGLPDVYNSINTGELQTQVKSLLEEAIITEFEYHDRTDYIGQFEDSSEFPQRTDYIGQFEDSSEFPQNPSRGMTTTNILQSIIHNLLAHLTTKDYLRRSQLDKNVRVQSFIRKGGFKGDGINALGRSWGRLYFHFRCVNTFQIRTEQPLPEFVSMEDELCHGEYPKSPYSPKVYAIRNLKERPVTVSGHWVGDPCEFGLVSFHALNKCYDRFVKVHGLELAREEMLGTGLVTGFTSTAAQAHNQGFNMHWDVTYPLTTQTVVTDGQYIQFFTYQLNTLHMWRADEANSRRNLLWASENMKLYDTIENGQVKGLNDQAVENLIKFFLLEPCDRGVDLRPYLPEEEAPVKTKLYINHVGDEPLEHPVIGRWQYPVNAVYF